MQKVVTVTDVTWLFEKKKFKTVVGGGGGVEFAVRLLDKTFQESRL